MREREGGERGREREGGRGGGERESESRQRQGEMGLLS